MDEFEIGEYRICAKRVDEMMRDLDERCRAVWYDTQHRRLSRRRWASEDRRKSGARKRRKWGM